MANSYPVDRDELYSLLNEMRQVVRKINLSIALQESVLQCPNFRPDLKDKLLNACHIHMAAAQGDAQRILEFLEAGNTANDAISITAFCGHHPIVSELLKRGANPTRGLIHSILGGHLPIMLDLIEHGANKAHATRLAFLIFDLHPHLLLWLMQSHRETVIDVETHARDAGFFDTRRSAAAFLAKIADLTTRKMLAYTADRHEPENAQLVRLAPLLRIVDWMIRYTLDYEEALAWYENFNVLPVLLLQEHGACGLPNDLWEMIACHLNPPGSAPLSVAQMHRVKIAIRQAYEPAWFNRLASQLERRPNGKAKAEHLRLAITMPDRINVLCEQRWNRRVRTAFLPKSVRQTMLRYPQYCNGLTLQRWLVNCTDYLEHRVSKKQRQLGMQLRNLIQVIPFPGESDNARQLATLLEENHGQPQSVRGLLKNLPYWNDLMELFPAVSECMSREIKSKKIIRWAC